MTLAERCSLLVARARSSSLGLKLALMGALLTAAVVGGTFIVLRVSTEANVTQVLVGEMHATQAALRHIEDRNRSQLLQSALLVSNSPTLKAAVDAWRLAGDASHPTERLATIDGALGSAFDGLGVDLILITDDSGRVLTARSDSGSPLIGSSLRSLPALRSALYGTSTSADSTYGVVQVGGAPIELAVVPLLVHQFPVGALVLGKRLDHIVPVDATADTRQIVSSGGLVLASTLSQLPVGSRWKPRESHGSSRSATTRVGGEDYVAASLPLGYGLDGESVELVLMRPLLAAIQPIKAELKWRFLSAGLLAVLLIGIGSVALSHTTLRPLGRFVRFMQAGTSADGFATFDDPHAPTEIRALTDTYNKLIESLQRGHEQVQQRTVDLAKANHRLNRQIHHRERAERALRESEDQLRQAQKLEALGALAGGVAHDFNNILSIILGYAEIVQTELPADSSQRVDVIKISDAAVRARALVRQLLAFSRKQVLQPQVVDLNEIVAGVQPLLRPLIGADVVLEVKLDPELLRVMADPSQIEQVIINLAVNARDAMPNGGSLTIETANVTLEARSGHHPMPPGPVVMLAVTDSGTGMDAATRRRIFEPFFTTKPVGKGTGLGLATVYGIMRQSEGNVTVYSEPGEGSVFRCYFPPAVAVVESAEDTASGASSGTRGAETILLAEDEPQLRELMRRALQRQGYEVLEATDGADALEVAAAFPGTIHMLVTDVVMPHTSGTELAEQLLRSRPGLRVVFISGYSNEAIERHGMLAPDSVFLQKPISPEVLSRAVHDLLDAEFAARSEM